MIHKACKVHHLLSKHPRAPQPALLLEILKELHIVLHYTHYATRRGAENVVGLTFFERLLKRCNRLACHCRPIRPISQVESNQAPTVLLLRERDLHAAGSQHFNHGFAHLGKETISHATREVADCYGRPSWLVLARYLRRRQHLPLHSIPQRFRRESRKAAPARQFNNCMHTRKLAKYTQAASANVIAATCNGKLSEAKKANRDIKQAWACHRSKDHLLQPRQAFRFNGAMPHIQDQAR